MKSYLFLHHHLIDEETETQRGEVTQPGLEQLVIVVLGY